MTQTAGPAFDDPIYLMQLRRDLLRFARLQLRDAAAAEDAVQEALAAAWSQADRFAGQSEHKTWVFGILRHKLVDTLRARKRTVNLSELDSELEGEALLDRELFKDNGHWSSEANRALGRHQRLRCASSSSGSSSRCVLTTCPNISAACS